ncbi:hypothetical protein HA402_004474 [Bradysia odoriphaga]|nr:hypothetical protein HA402_004474 [Bradysia odoriphaga]
MLIRGSSRWRYEIIRTKTNWQNIRCISLPAQGHVKADECPNDAWDTAKPYSSIPGPSKLELIKLFAPGGQFHKANFLEVNKAVYKKYGPIVKFDGLFGNHDNVFIFDPKDIETVFRNEGPWPFRKGLATTLHYRKTLRSDIFQNSIGLVN